MFFDLKPKNLDDISFNILAFDFSKPVEPDRLFDCLPNSLRPSAAGGGGGKNHSEKQSGEAVTFTLPTLIPPRVLPLLHELAIQMVQAGHQQQLFRVYT
ncbi:exocyst complex component EXO70A1-like [Trifolium medium]|uniref:Exocyst complex component EXO70A1-like n=1 Tax=Trifolium medium TaxID=97028 RepID=A0A392Q1Q5_9FABA|nr:exocyst complex component EXO70A1-like [Trifolium medium]